jgi:preprotein translocase subunit SecG
MAPPQRQKSGAGTGAAVMYILGAIFLLITMGLGAMVAAAGSALGTEIEDFAAIAAYLWGVCVALPLIGMIFGFLGMAFIFQRKNFNMAMIGGILGLVAGIVSGILVIKGIPLFNPIGLLAFIFFLIGIILLFVAKKDFD